MNQLIGLLLAVLFPWSVLAQPCATGSSPYGVKSLQDISTESCMNTLRSKECQDLFAQMKKNREKPEEKALQCHKRGSVSRAFETSWNYASGCAIGGWNFVKDSFVTLGTAIGEGAAKIVLDNEQESAANAACDKNFKLKKALFADYNSSVPKLLKVDAPADSILAKTNCASVKATLKMARIQKANEAGGRISAKMMRITRMTGGDTNLTADEKEFMEWGSSKSSSSKVDLTTLAKNYLKEMGVKLECYNSQEAAAMVCEAIASVGSLAAGPAGAALKAAKASNIMKIAGVALDTEKAASAGAAARAVASTADLEKAAALTNIQRIEAAENSLGRPLTEAEKKALVAAHEVGSGTGRGYGTYSATDLKQKADLLKAAGLSDSERALLMRRGLAGSLSDTRAAKNYATTFRLQAEKLNGEGKVAEAKQSFKSAADSYEVVIKDTKIEKSSRDYWVGAKLNASAERYDKAADYFIKSFSAERDSNSKVQAVYEALNREKDELRVIAYKNPGSAGAQQNYESHRKLIEAVVNNSQFRLSDAYKRELLKP